MANTLAHARQRFFDAQGVPLAFGKVWTYNAGTNVPRPTFADAGEVTANPNPVILDVNGEATIYWRGTYKVNLTTSADAQVPGWPEDDVADVSVLAAKLLSTSTGEGASQIGVEDAGGYWQAANQEGINQEAGALLVNIRSMGADVTGATASDVAMAAAFAKSHYVLIPAGCDIALDTTLYIGAGQVLWIGPNATVKRRAGAVSTDPVLYLQASSSSVIGAGASSIVATEKACPRGIIRLGAESMAADTPTDCQFNAVRNIRIRGKNYVDALFPNYGQTSGSPDVGIISCNPQISGSVVSYFHRLTDLWISGVNYCIQLQGFANANQLRDLHFERFGSPGIPGRGIFFDGAEENNVVNLWHHFAPYSTGLYFARHVGAVRNYDAAWNSCLNVQSEAGANANMFTLDAFSFENVIQGTDNNGLASALAGTANTLMTTDRSDLVGPASIRNQVPGSNGLLIVGATGQTSNVLQIRNSASANLFNVDPYGNADVALSLTAQSLRADGAPAGVAGTVTFGNTTQTTVGAAGPASTLPATPEFYLRFFNGTTEYVIPAYKRV